MSWPFGRKPEPEADYRPPRLEVVERSAPITFEPKPDELLQAAGEWERPAPARVIRMDMKSVEQPPTVPMSATPPNAPGVYWWTEPGAQCVRLATVLRFGRGLSVRTRRGDTRIWVSVESLKRTWSTQPLPIPEGMDLEVFA